MIRHFMAVLVGIVGYFVPMMFIVIFITFLNYFLTGEADFRFYNFFAEYSTPFHKVIVNSDFASSAPSLRFFMFLFSIVSVTFFYSLTKK